MWSVSSEFGPSGRLVFYSTSGSSMDEFKRIDVQRRDGLTRLFWVSGSSHDLPYYTNYNYHYFDSIAYSLKKHKAPILRNGWANFGLPYAKAGFALDDDTVYLRGLVRNRQFSSKKPLFILPSEYRPRYLEVFPASVNDRLGHISVLPTGEVKLSSAFGRSGFASLSNVRFRPSTTRFTNLVTERGWRRYSKEQAPLSYSKSTGLVHLRGVVYYAGTNSRAWQIANLPEDITPHLDRHFAVAGANGTAVVSIVGNKLLFGGNHMSAGWVSLAGIVYRTYAQN